MPFSFVIESKLPTLNEYILAERQNRYAGANMKKHATNTCSIYSLSLPKDLQGLFDISIHWVVENNRSDSDNIFMGIKWILDGMVKSGRLNGDGRKHIRNICHSIETGDKYSVTVTLIEVQ